MEIFPALDISSKKINGIIEEGWTSNFSDSLITKFFETFFCSVSTIEINTFETFKMWAN